MIILMIARICVSKNSFFVILFFNTVLTLFCGLILSLEDLSAGGFAIDIAFIYALVGFISTVGILKYYSRV
jgi:multisubunit Na+/H+ antiporter MnhF subunit